MSFAEGKEFVMKDVFADALNMEKEKDYWGKEVTHFKIPWKMSIYKGGSYLRFYLKCLKSSINWAIDTDIEVKLSNGDTYNSGTINISFCAELPEIFVNNIEFQNLENHLVDDNLTVEMHVKIITVTGEIKKKLRSFDDESAKKFSDVVLIVETEKFHVFKMFLASHSSYFEALFTGNFDESKQSEITLKDVDPDDYQDFLDLIHGESDVNDETVDGILKLADMYDSPSAIRRCETFLIKHSERSLKQKFGMAIKYKMDELKNQCLDEINTKEGIISVLPEDVHQMDQTVWAELLHKSISLM